MAEPQPVADYPMLHSEQEPLQDTPELPENLQDTPELPENLQDTPELPENVIEGKQKKTDKISEDDQNGLDDLDEIEFLLDEIEDQIAPLA
jgi:hypothetical protein